jgi:hypothetical protein
MILAGAEIEIIDITLLASGQPSEIEIKTSLEKLKQHRAK